MKHMLLITLFATLSFNLYAKETARWGYDGEDSPEHWGKLSNSFSLCETGKNQSPIDIKNVIKSKHHNLQLDFKANAQWVENNGHTIQVNDHGESRLILDNDTFVMQQFHFHTPSEHLILGHTFPLEAHFVYQDKEGEVAVLALMFEQGKKNSQLQYILQQLPAQPGQHFSLKNTVNVRHLLPAKFDYYRYNGSLTTPPCSEGVTWLIIDTPVTLSKNQLNLLQNAVHQHNNRPVQPLHGRQIVE